MRLAPLLVLTACGGESSDTTATGPTDTGTPATEPPEPVTCAEPHASSCGDDGAVVRGVAIAGPEGPTTGTLVVYLTHHDLGEDSQGGVYHTSATYEVDLSDGPKRFQVDMCEGGEMWPEDFGDYNLVVILDQDGNNEPAGFGSNRLPDPGEPSARVFPVSIERAGESVCLDDVVLDCLDGPSCGSY